MRTATLLVACLVVLAAHVLAQERMPRPEPAHQRQAERSVRETYKAEYARRPAADKLALAKTLLQRARDGKDDAVLQFVLLQEARALAVQAGNLEVGMQAVRETTRRFQVVAHVLTAELLAAAGKAARTPTENLVLARAWLQLAREAAEVEDADAAGKAVAAAATLARTLKDTPLLALVSARTKEATDLKAWLARVASARSTLAKDPDDAAAHAIVGQHEALIRCHWDEGVVHLSKCAEPELKALAIRDLGDPSDADEQAVLGDSWWDLAERQTGPARLNARQRALFWYEKSSRLGASGLAKARIEDRMPPLRIEKLTRGDWLEVGDLALYDAGPGVGGGSGVVEIVPKPEFSEHAELIQVPGDIDGLAVRVRPGQGRGLQAYVIYQREKEGILFERSRGVSAVWQSKDLLWDHHFGQKPKSADEFHVAVILMDGAAVVYLDGVEIGRVKTELRALDYLALRAGDGPVRFDQIRLRRRPLP
jgi:hypothetical protein